MTARRLMTLLAVAAAAAVAGALAPASGASRTASLPTLRIALKGVKGITISSTTVQSGAVSVVSTFSGKLPRNSQGPSAGIIRLNPGVTIQEAARAVNSHQGDLDALTRYGSLLVSVSAPSTVQTTLSPGNYVALNDSGNGQPAFAPFTVTASSSPAKLPAAAATETAIEFAFRGPAVLHEGAIVRARNGGYLVHMVTLIGVRDLTTAHTVMTLLRAGKDNQAAKLASRNFANLLGPASPGAMQQQVLHVPPGYYIEACFMDTQDHREHTQLGMMRLVRVVK